MHRFRTEKLLGVFCCILVISGCATQSPRSDLTGSDPNEIKMQQMLLQNMNRHYQSGRQYQEAGEYPAAITAYEAALAIDPKFAEAHNGLGVVYALMDDYPPAIRHLTTAAGLAPLASHIHNNLGYAHLLQGDLADAERAIVQALQLDPENERAHTNLMTVRQQMRLTGE